MRRDWFRAIVLTVVLSFAVMPVGEALAWGCSGGFAAEALRALADSSEQPLPVERLRAGGPAALAELMSLRSQMQKQLVQFQKEEPTKETTQQMESLQRRQVRLDELIDQVGMQRYCSRSGLYWYTDLEKAKTAAQASGKPILSLRMLGNLNEDFSCANSRFFRTTLYANDQISQALRQNYVLHWKSVRPVPKVTIDFGDGRKLERTLTGNSIHYILTPEGEVVEALPGLYGPQAFLQKINAGASLARRVAVMSPTERIETLAAYHRERLASLDEALASDVARVNSQVVPEKSSAIQVRTAVAANELAAPKGRVERRLVAAAVPLASTPRSSNPEQLQDDAVWGAIAALHAGEAELDQASRELIRSQNPMAAVAGRLAVTKRVVEDPMLRLVRTLQETIALDTVRNEYQLHRRIHQWLADGSYRPEVDVLNERVYGELFLTPSSDPWLGLAGADVYTALPNGGVARSAN
jgi:hypothetical protein